MLSNLHNAGMPPSRLGMGCEPLGGSDWGSVDIAEARRAVRRALDVGITVFDTADVYGLGRGETELGGALGDDRHSAFIITKFGVRWDSEGNEGRARTFRDSSPAYIIGALEDSLRRLRVEAIPLYLVHWPDTSVPLSETLDCLEGERQKGKILNFGLSNFEASDVEQSIKSHNVAAVEGSYSLIDSLHSRDMFSCARKGGIATFAYGPLGQGLLTGKYTKDSVFGPDDRRHRLPQFSGSRWQQNKTLLEQLEIVAKHHGHTVSQTAIRWVLDSDLIDTVIVGAKSEKQIDDNAGALLWEIADDERKNLELYGARAEMAADKK